MKVLITFALANEFAPWRKLRSFRSGRLGSADVHSAEINGANVCVALTGAGTRHAREFFREILSSCSDSFGLCVSSGLAGALKPEYQVGQVLAARSVASERPDPATGDSEISCSEPLVSLAAEYGAKTVDRFFTSERVIARAEEKQYLGRKADAVEMESCEILREARAFGIPAVSIRAISDTSYEHLPLDMPRIFSDEGQVSLTGVVAEIARHPRSLPDLLRLGQQSKFAAESLAKFLDRYVAGVVERSRDIQTVAAVAS